jgi:hypothetical protein
MTKNEKTALYVVGGLAVVGAGIAIYVATREDKPKAMKTPSAPSLPAVDIQAATPTATATEIPQAEILQQQQQQQQQAPPPQVIIPKNFQQFF